MRKNYNDQLNATFKQCTSTDYIYTNTYPATCIR